MTDADPTTPKKRRLPGRPLRDDDPRRLGRYDVLRVLGRGGMGTVFLARQTNLDRLVAVKTLGGVSKIRADWRKRFRREIAALSRLHHPNVVTILDSGEDADTGLLFYAMEFIDGRPLRKWIGRKTSLKAVVRILYKVALALEHIHAHGITHRDLKPENLLIDRYGEVKLTDFGIVKLSEEAPDDPQVALLTAEGTTLGTKAYMAPEQMFGRRTLGPPADVYALGVIAYELLTGVRPKSEAPKPTRLFPGLPEWVDLLIDMMLTLEPSRRLQDGGQVREFLARHARKAKGEGLPEVGVIPGVSSPPPPSPKFTPPPSQDAGSASDEVEDLGTAIHPKVARRAPGTPEDTTAAERSSLETKTSEVDVEALLADVPVEEVDLGSDDAFLINEDVHADIAPALPVARRAKADPAKFAWVKRACPICKGTGQRGKHECPYCQGSKRVYRRRSEFRVERLVLAAIGGGGTLLCVALAAAGFARLTDQGDFLNLFGPEPAPYVVTATVLAGLALAAWGYDLTHGPRHWRPVEVCPDKGIVLPVARTVRHYALRVAVGVAILGGVIGGVAALLAGG